MSAAQRYIDAELGVKFELTADAHSRKVYYYDSFVGTLLFHDWEFKLELGPAVPLPLKVATSILNKAQEDESINHQRLEDQRKFMAANARQELKALGIDTSTMTDQKAVETYLLAPNERPKPQQSGS